MAVKITARPNGPYLVEGDVEQSGRIFVETAENLVEHLGHAARRVGEAFALRIFADGY